MHFALMRECVSTYILSVCVLLPEARSSSQECRSVSHTKQKPAVSAFVQSEEETQSCSAEESFHTQILTHTSAHFLSTAACYLTQCAQSAVGRAALKTYTGPLETTHPYGGLSSRVHACKHTQSTPALHVRPVINVLYAPVKTYLGREGGWGTK